MYCPECGEDAGQAKFCPECGTKLDEVRSARSGAKTTGTVAKKKAGAGGAGAGVQAPTPKGGSGMNPMYVWIIVAVVAVIGVVAVWSLTRSDGTSTTSGGKVDTSGSYSDLVQRANGLYDQGQAKIDGGDFEGGATLFGDAANVYAAAWAQQPGDPAVGTDYATALFYSGNIEVALTQIAQVLKDNPTFQNALYNKGNFLAHKARIAAGSGNKAQAAKLRAEAKLAYEAAIKVDPTSGSGKAAASAIKTLDQTKPAQ
jgi:hypothetical protein